jgi:hypothetical protein
MEVPMMSEPFARGDERGPADAHGAGLVYKPMPKRLSVMPVILLREKRQQEPVRWIRSARRWIHRSFLLACGAELDRRLGIEEPDPFGLQLREQPVGFRGRHGHDDFQGLIGELNEKRRVDASMVAKTLARGNKSRPADAHGTRLRDEPMGERLPMMPVVLLREKRQLVTVHGILAQS